MAYKKTTPEVQSDVAKVVSSGVLTAFSVSDDSMVLPALQEVDAEVLERFIPKKEQTEILAQSYARQELSRLERVARCGEFLEFAVRRNSAKLRRASFCKDRLCPMCNWRRSLKIFGQMSQVFDLLLDKPGVYGRMNFLLLTLTNRNVPGEQLPAAVNMMMAGKRYLYHKCPEFQKSVLGAMWSLEVTRNMRAQSSAFGTYHPHFHVLLAVPADYFTSDLYMTKDEWAELWRHACDLDYDPVVDVRRITSKRRKGIKGAVCEVSKYAVKGSDYLFGTDEDIDESVRVFLSALSSRKLVSWTGIFNQARKALKLDDAEDGDLVRTDNVELEKEAIDFYICYNWRCGFYVRELFLGNT